MSKKNGGVIVPSLCIHF